MQATRQENHRNNFDRWTLLLSANILQECQLEHAFIIIKAFVIWKTKPQKMMQSKSDPHSITDTSSHKFSSFPLYHVTF